MKESIGSTTSMLKLRRRNGTTLLINTLRTLSRRRERAVYLQVCESSILQFKFQHLLKRFKKSAYTQHKINKFLIMNSFMAVNKMYNVYRGFIRGINKVA